MNKRKGKQYSFDKEKAYKLIEDLKEDPFRFYKNKQSNSLLLEFYRGFPKDSLRPLLRSENQIIKREAIWIVSELGVDGEVLLDEIIPLLNDDDSYIVAYASEIVALCARNIDEFIMVFKCLEHPDDSVKHSVINLIINMSDKQLEWAYDYFKSKKDINHSKGILALLNYKFVTNEQIDLMIESKEDVISQYGIIISKKKCSSI